MSLEELRQKRLKWVEANRENDFEEGIRRLLTNLYPDNAHFIYELLQNAEDVKATEVRFILKEDGIEFEHNGSQLFTLDDVKYITSIGISTKKDDPTNIGEFGVGFKAVFSYTNTPEIMSGKYHFRIRDLVVPDTEKLSPCAHGKKETRFLFPFDNPQKSPEKACTEIEENLRHLDESTLLFLKNIKKIKYLLPNSTLGFLERKEKDGNRIEILVQHPEDPEATSIFFIRFEKTVAVNDEDDKIKSCRIATAFGLGERKEDVKRSDKNQKQIPTSQWRITSLKPGRVFIYFPAEKETSNLRFHLHAPFASTVARDSVRDCAANIELRDHLADLITESMSAIRDQGLLDVVFLATLPNNKDNLSPFYKPIMERLINLFHNEPLIPMQQGGYAAGRGVFRGRPARLSDLIVDDDLATLLGKSCSSLLWITNPPQKNQREDNFLSMLDISEWTIEDLVIGLSGQSEKISKWLSQKPYEWFQQLYGLLCSVLDNGDDLNREIADLKIVRLSNGTYSKGSKAFFPDADRIHDQTFPRVTKEVYSSGKNESEQKKAHKFLKDIGVREVGEADRIEVILKHRYSQDSIRPQAQDINRFMKFVERNPKQINLFKNYYIFQLENQEWGKPSMVFLDCPYFDTGLRAYYEALGHDSGQKWTLSSRYREAGIDPEQFEKFALKIGVQVKIKAHKQQIPWNHPEKNTLQDDGGWSSYYGINEDYDIPEFDILLTRSDLNKSKLIASTMNQQPDHILQASYRSNSWYNKSTANSSLVWKLRRNSWIPQKQGAKEEFFFVMPSEAIVELLPSSFPFHREMQWLEAIEFGKAERDRQEKEYQEQEQATQEYQRKREAAETLGFSSVEEAEDVIQMLAKYPELISKLRAADQKPVFPERSPQNPERKQEKVSQEYTHSPKKKYEPRKRSVRITQATAFTRTCLKNQYTNSFNQMICQICQNKMPFKKRDGEYYFEAVEALSKEYFSKEHEAQFLALCPLCAAKYKEFVKYDESAMHELHRALKNSNSLEVPLRLGDWKINLRFVETHRQDLRTILNQ